MTDSLLSIVVAAVLAAPVSAAQAQSGPAREPAADLAVTQSISSTRALGNVDADKRVAADEMRKAVAHAWGEAYEARLAAVKAALDAAATARMALRQTEIAARKRQDLAAAAGKGLGPQSREDLERAADQANVAGERARAEATRALDVALQAVRDARNREEAANVLPAMVTLRLSFADYADWPDQETDSADLADLLAEEAVDGGEQLVVGGDARRLEGDARLRGARLDQHQRGAAGPGVLAEE